MIGTSLPASPHVAQAGLERSVWYSGYLLTFLATGAETGGRFSVVEEIGRRDASAPPPLHIHTREEEYFYVIEGEMTFFVGDETIAAPAGTFVRLPRGVPHTFVIATQEVRMLNICTPAGFEGFFRDLSEPAMTLTLPPAPDGPPDIAKLQATAAAYGLQVVGPPPPTSV